MLETWGTVGERVRSGSEGLETIKGAGLCRVQDVNPYKSPPDISTFLIEPKRNHCEECRCCMHAGRFARSCAFCGFWGTVNRGVLARAFGMWRLCNQS